jgi:hypothetical protein
MSCRYDRVLYACSIGLLLLISSTASGQASPPEEEHRGESVGEAPARPATPARSTPSLPSSRGSAASTPSPATTRPLRVGPRLSLVPSSGPAPLGRQVLSLSVLPGAVLADGQDRFYLVYRDRVLRVGRRVEGSYLFPVAVTPRLVAVNQAGMLGTAVLVSRMQCSRGGRCRRWSELLTLTCSALGPVSSSARRHLPGEQEQSHLAARCHHRRRGARGLRPAPQDLQWLGKAAALSQP